MTIRGGTLAWREWGAPSEPPVLALHGWLDNAASFEAIAPRLAGCRVIAPDLPGHGLSAHRGPEGTYNIWDDLPDLLAFLRALEIPRCAVLGHSRGAFVGTLLAAIAPASVGSLALLDGLAPPPFDPADTVTQLRTFAEDYGLRETRGARLYPDVREAIEARCRATGIDPRAAAMLVQRSLVQEAGGFRWRTDGRLRYASAQKLGEPQLRTVLGSVQAPALLLLAEGMISERTAQSGMTDWLPGLRIESIPGCHHWHMLDAAPAIAARLLAFWSEHGH